MIISIVYYKRRKPHRRKINSDNIDHFKNKSEEDEKNDDL